MGMGMVYRITSIGIIPKKDPLLLAGEFFLYLFLIEIDRHAKDKLVWTCIQSAFFHRSDIGIDESRLIFTEAAFVAKIDADTTKIYPYSQMQTNGKIILNRIDRDTVKFRIQNVLECRSPKNMKGSKYFSSNQDGDIDLAHIKIIPAIIGFGLGVENFWP